MNRREDTIEEFARVVPYALVFLVKGSLELILGTISWSSRVPTKTVLCICVYVSGLISLERDQTQSRIARTIGQVSHDALNRLAKELPKLVPGLYDCVFTGLQLLTGMAPLPGYLILDDVTVPKPFSRHTAGSYMGYDPTQKRHIRCQKIVVVIWSNGIIHLPVAFAFWHHRDFVSRYRSKNQIARALVWLCVRRGIRLEYLSFDNWYASKENLRFFAGLGIIYVTRLRCNTWIKHNGTRQKIHQLSKYESHYYSKLDAYVKQFEIEYPGFGQALVAVVKHDKHAESGRTKYLLSNAHKITNSEFVCMYRSRWNIEVFFRTCKQSFGLGECQAQMMDQVLLHVRMVMLAYIMTQLLMTHVGDESISIEKMQTNLRSMHILHLPRQKPVMVSMKQDGTMIPLSLPMLLNPVRTCLGIPLAPWNIDFNDSFIDA
jgi:hypothetical protein